MAPPEMRGCISVSSGKMTSYLHPKRSTRSDPCTDCPAKCLKLIYLDTFQVDLEEIGRLVPLIDQFGQHGDQLASVSMASKIQAVLPQGGEPCQKLNVGEEQIIHSAGVGALDGPSTEADSSRSLQEQQVCTFVPGVVGHVDIHRLWREKPEGADFIEHAVESGAARTTSHPHDYGVVIAIVLRLQIDIVDILI